MNQSPIQQPNLARKVGLKVVTPTLAKESCSEREYSTTIRTVAYSTFKSKANIKVQK